MERAKAESHPVPSGNMLTVLVSLCVVFLLFTAFLGAVKRGELFTEQNLLYVALILYGAATVLYLGFGVTGIHRYVQAASLATWLGFLTNTLAVGHRWYIAGHPPFSSIYEMLLSFVWTLAALTIFVERRYHVQVIGTVTMPIATLSVILIQLLPSEVRPLVPALQSTWLHIHVSLAMLAYAACAVSFALAMMFLIQDRLRTETFLAATSAFLLSVYIGIATRFDPSGGLRLIAWDAQGKQEIFFAEKTRLMVVVPELGWFFFLVLAAVLVPLVLYFWATMNRIGSALTWANRAFFVGALLQVVALIAFILRVREGVYPSSQVEGLFATNLSASPFILAGLVGGVFASMLYLLLLWRRSDLERMLPSADTLDVLTYKTIGIGFPLLTLMIAAGAYWANRTWGSYWSWDPKETWALITWLVYAGYLHMRITRGWRGRRAAYFAIIGFAVVLFTFFGVTYLLRGLHAYA
ncbi:MAG: c-type cytochrome biogenesis protein CcsB [Acidobacteria bacterium]|nr:c-type cytochrome biogenesis protein CcsB [Acidobacteriota bacterium]